MIYLGIGLWIATAIGYIWFFSASNRKKDQ